MCVLRVCLFRVDISDTMYNGICPDSEPVDANMTTTMPCDCLEGQTPICAPNVDVQVCTTELDGGTALWPQENLIEICLFDNILKRKIHGNTINCLCLPTMLAVLCKNISTFKVPLLKR